jgi:Protein of unknown function (DUF1176)
MLSATAVALITATIASHALTARQPLSRAVIAAGLQRAQCTIPPDQAKIVGSEWLGRELQIVEVSCWRAARSAGSILFAVPVNRTADAHLITIEDWRHGRVVPGYRVASPGYDRTTRTLASIRKGRRVGDCGTIKEWKWTGWFFRLIHVWSKSHCDGEGFEWDNRHRWQVFPQPSKSPPQPPSGFNGPSLSKCPPRCSHQSSTRLGRPASAQIAKNHTHPVAAAIKPALDDR